MLSLFVVNANLAPVVFLGKAEASDPGQGLGPDPPRWAAVLGFYLFLPFFFLSGVCVFHLFYSEELEIDRPAWREESPLP